MKLLYLVSRPTQHQAPLLRQIEALPNIELQVLFERTDEAGASLESDFETALAWEIPLAEGYASQVLDGTRDLRSFIQNSDVVWLHGWDSWPRQLALDLARKAGRPVLMRGANTLCAMPDGWGPRGALKRRYLKRIFSRCTGFLCVGSENRHYYASHGVDPSRLFDMPLAVDNDFIQVQVELAERHRDALRQELRIDAGTPVILCVGDLHRRNHPLAVLQAVESLARDSQSVCLLYVGNGPRMSALEAKVADTCAQVRLLGSRNRAELPAYYGLADILVLASDAEAWGQVVNEAMNGSCVPVVSDGCGCATDLIEEGWGRVVVPGDVSGLADTLADLVGDLERLNQMGQAAREHIGHWGLDESVEGLLQALAATGGASSRELAP